MKRILAILLAAVLIACAAGCGKIEQVPPETAESTGALGTDASETGTAGTETATEATTAAAPETTQEEQTIQPVIYNGTDPLTGLGGYDSYRYEKTRPIAIVVENHPSARPQWGMSAPDVILEYEVEGGISRMLWLFSNPDEVPEKVGPVRSLRHDVYELALGYDAMLIHCGSSNIVREMFPTYAGLNSRFDLISSEDSMAYRDHSRNVSSEHTLVLLGDRMRSFLSSHGDLTLRDEYRNPFRFAPVEHPFLLTSGTCKSLHYEFSGYYTYTFHYNETTMLYDQDINGSPRNDANGIRSSFKNVIILYVDTVSENDSAGHQDLLLEKGGSGLYATNGTYMNVTWKKEGVTDMLKVYGQDGSELTMNAGRTYIGLVRSTQSGLTTLG